MELLDSYSSWVVFHEYSNFMKSSLTLIQTLYILLMTFNYGFVFHLQSECAHFKITNGELLKMQLESKCILIKCTILLISLIQYAK